MRFLSPRPSSTGSMAALPAPAGGRFGLFRGYSTQRNCLLLRWASRRVQDERKSSKEVSRQSPHNEERGLWSPQPSALVCLARGIWISRGTGISSATRCLRGQVSSWCCRAEKRQAVFYTAVRLIFQKHSFEPILLLFRTGCGSQLLSGVCPLQPLETDWVREPSYTSLSSSMK